MAGAGHIALSALPMVCCDQAAAKQMVVELSLIFADLPNPPPTTIAVDMAIR